MFNSLNSGEPIPYDTIPFPGDNVMRNLSYPRQEFLEQYCLKFLFPNDPKVQADFKKWREQPHIAHEHKHYEFWMCSLRWLYKKKWNSNYEIISHPKKIIESLEPFGELLRSALLLCEQCYLYGEKFGYSHHLYWFNWIASDLFKFSFDCPDGTDKLVIKLRAASESLKDKSANHGEKSKNPFDSIETPTLWQLAESCLTLIYIEGNQNLYDQYLTKEVTRKKKSIRASQPFGFTTALSAWANRIHTDENLVQLERTHNAISANLGKGKGKKTIHF